MMLQIHYVMKIVMTSAHANITHKVHVAIDMGAKSTGLYILTHESERSHVSGKDASAATIVMDTANYKTSMQDRRQARHRIRNQKRSKMAARLLKIIVEHKCARKLESSEEEALRHMLNRRGYSRLTSEIDLSVLDDVDPAILADQSIFSEFFNSEETVRRQWDEIVQDVDELRRFADAVQDSRQFKTQYVNSFKESYPEIAEESKTYLLAITRMLECAREIIEEVDFGNKHRREYISDIRHDIRNDRRLDALCQIFEGADRLVNLVANISNLQLRALRNYFNLKCMKAGDVFINDRLLCTLSQALRYYHYETDQLEIVRPVMNELDKAGDAIEFLCTCDPELTIPPYEDQNNRRPPVDQTLLLDPVALNKKYGDSWLVWVDRFVRNDPVLEEMVDEITKLCDRSSRSTKLGGNPLADSYYRASYILQRILDRNHKLDPIGLRSLSRNLSVQNASARVELLGNMIGSQHVEEFLKFAGSYYREVDDAKRGLWVRNEEKLLERSGIHPPMNSKVRYRLVANILQSDEDKAREFVDSVWKKRVTGNSTVMSCCKKIEEIRKKYGNEFNFRYKPVARLESVEKKDLKDLPMESSVVDDMVAVRKRVDAVRDEVCTRFGDKFCNPFSMAQLFNIIEDDPHGFTATCLAVHLENAWRMSSPSSKDEVFAGANCSRLPADTGRPFDGQLGRVIDRQAYEIAKMVADQIRTRVAGCSPVVDVSLIVEQNKFAFTASLDEIKSKATTAQAAKKIQESNERLVKNLMAKEDRIKSDSRNICAYTGLQLDDSNGEIDHIIPRSLTTERMGTIFNAECNLIYVSRTGNQQKSNYRYRLENLDDRYLQAVFSTSNRQEVSRIIDTNIATLVREGRLGRPDLMQQLERDCIRHALFLDDGSESREAVIRSLGNANKAKVNGTQGWLVKKIISKLDVLLSDWRESCGGSVGFSVCKSGAQETSRIRQGLGSFNQEFEKAEIQSPASHSIDAMCAFVCQLNNERVRKQFGIDDEYAGDAENWSLLAGLHPGSCSIKRISSKNILEKEDFASRKIFKESIYGEQFLPIIAYKGGVYIGYSTKSDSGRCLEVTGTDKFALLRTIAPYLDKPLDEQSGKTVTYKIDKHKAYELFNKKFNNPGLCTDEENLQLKVLNSLHFLTTRKEITGVLFTQGKIKEASKIAKAVNKGSLVTVSKVKLGKIFSYGGKVVLPFAGIWNDTIEEIKDHFGGWSFSEDDLRKFLRSNCPSGRNKHSKSRRVFSLPMLPDNVSGAVRIRRSNTDGTSVYQVGCADTKYSGFATDDQGKIDWKTPVVPAQLSGNKITALPAGSAGSEVVESENKVSMLETRTVVDFPDLKVIVKVNSKDRCRITIEMPYTQFCEVVGIKETALQLVEQIKVPIVPHWKEYFNNVLAKNGIYEKDLVNNPRTEKDKPWKFNLDFVSKEKIVFNYESPRNKAIENMFQS